MRARSSRKAPSRASSPPRAIPTRRGCWAVSPFPAARRPANRWAPSPASCPRWWATCAAAPSPTAAVTRSPNAATRSPSTATRPNSNGAASAKRKESRHERALASRSRQPAILDPRGAVPPAQHAACRQRRGSRRGTRRGAGHRGRIRLWQVHPGPHAAGPHAPHRRGHQAGRPGHPADGPPRARPPGAADFPGPVFVLEPAPLDRVHRVAASGGARHRQSQAA
ncbi:hypothetical protein G6F65_018437 [Rhizopus arrhizus]|nr:hypothetical protein G6F65_018437 [Rhizopus arrhizus]